MYPKSKSRIIKVVTPIIWFVIGLMCGWLLPAPAAYALRSVERGVHPYRVAETTILFQRLCAELLPTTPLGRHYRDLGFEHMNDLVKLLWYDQTMLTQTWHVIDLYTPAVEALLDGRGETVRIDREMVDSLLVFLSEMEKRADPELQEIIQKEREKVPWQELIGLTADEAWIELQEALPESSLP